MNKAASSTSRHLRWEALEQRIRAGPPSAERIKGSPEIQLFVDPDGSRVGIWVFEKADELPASPLAEVAVREVRKENRPAVEVSTTNSPLYRDFYSFCCTIADRVQTAGQPIGHALEETLASWSSLLRPRVLLTTDQQVGLLGELEFLLRVSDSLGWDAAASSWQGPGSEEHDFILPEADVEVKTTRGEVRIHQIGSLTQLLPKKGRPLVLLSVQLTAGGPGEGAQTLPRAVARVLNRAGRASQKAATSLRLQLRHLGWLDEDAPFYPDAYRLRSPLLVVPIDKSFPAILPATLAPLGKGGMARIRRVSYAIDIEGLGVSEEVAQFKKLLFGR